MDTECPCKKESHIRTIQYESAPTNFCSPQEHAFNFGMQNVGIHYAATSNPSCVKPFIHEQNRHFQVLQNFPPNESFEPQGCGRLSIAGCAEIPKHFYSTSQQTLDPPYFPPVAQDRYVYVTDGKTPKREVRLPQYASPFVREWRPFGHPVYPHSAPPKTHLILDKEPFPPQTSCERQCAFPYTDVKHACTNALPVFETQRRGSNGNKNPRARRRLGYDFEEPPSQAATDRKEVSDSVSCQIRCDYEINSSTTHANGNAPTIDVSTSQSKEPASAVTAPNYRQYNDGVAQSGITGVEGTHGTEVDNTKDIMQQQGSTVSQNVAVDDIVYASDLSDLVYKLIVSDAANGNFLKTDLGPTTNSDPTPKIAENAVSFDLSKNEFTLTQLLSIKEAKQQNTDKNPPPAASKSSHEPSFFPDGTPSIALKSEDKTKLVGSNNSCTVFRKGESEVCKNQYANESSSIPPAVTNVNTNATNCGNTTALNSNESNLLDQTSFKSFEILLSNSVLKPDCSKDTDLAQPLPLDESLEHTWHSGDKNTPILHLPENLETPDGANVIDNGLQELGNDSFDFTIDPFELFFENEKFLNEEMKEVNTNNECTSTVKKVNYSVADAATQTDENKVLQNDMGTQTNNQGGHTKDALPICPPRSTITPPNQCNNHGLFDRNNSNDRNNNKSTTNGNNEVSLPTPSKSDDSFDSFSVSGILSSISPECREGFDQGINGQPSVVKMCTKTYYNFGPNDDCRSSCFNKVVEKTTVVMFQGKNDCPERGRRYQKSPTRHRSTKAGGMVKNSEAPKRSPKKVDAFNILSAEKQQDKQATIDVQKNQRSPMKKPKKKVTFALDNLQQDDNKEIETNKPARKSPKRKILKTRKKTNAVADTTFLDETENYTVSSTYTTDAAEVPNEEFQEISGLRKNSRVRSSARYALRKLK